MAPAETACVMRRWQAAMLAGIEAVAVNWPQAMRVTAIVCCGKWLVLSRLRWGYR